MDKARPKVGVVLTLLELYRKAHPDMPAKFSRMWRGIVRGLLSGIAEVHFTEAAHTRAEVASAVRSCERAECDLLMVLPMAYATSGSARDALCSTKLPLLVVSTARDATLPHDMSGDHIMANHAVHAVQDLANVLGRAGRRFELIAGHHADAQFRANLAGCVKAAAGARVLRRGRVGRVGTVFKGMLDFSFEAKSLADAPLLAGGFKVVEVEARKLAALAGKVSRSRLGKFAAWTRKRFEACPDLTDDELSASARSSLALEDIVASEKLDAVSMNFLDVAAAGAPSMPFLGASRLLSRGVGYAGEGDVLTAALVAAAGRIAGEATFTETFCPDYERSEVLLSHMGECNFALADPARRVKLVAKEFAYGRCARPAVPVFQLRPGTVTLASLTEWPGEKFRLVVTVGEVVEAPEHVNLSSPYTRVSFGRDLAGFLEDYSRAGGTHHLALVYGDLRPEFSRLAGLCGIGFVSVQEVR